MPLQDILSNNKLRKRATGKEPGIDRKMRGGWDVSNNVRTNKILSFKNGVLHGKFLRKERATSYGWRKRSMGKGRKKGI